MPLVVVATFTSLTEAQIAAGGLAAGGLHPVVADQYFGSAVWTEQFALQGFRLSVPESEAADSLAFLATARLRRIKRPPRPAGQIVWRVLAVLLLLVLGPYGSWLATGGLQRRRPGSVAAVALTMLALLAIVFAVFAIDVAAGAWPFVGSFVPLAFAVVAVVVVARLMRARFETGAGSAASAPSAEAMDE